ncbi:MAG: hypothetical protein K2M20_00920 [Lachnospiraceae bacterium]|nr:hypothetical protein [Lachnospiraceae bacterium]
MRSRKRTMFLTGFLIVFTGLVCSACGGGQAESEKLEGSLQDMMASLYANADIVQDFRDNLDSYETMDLTDDLEISVLGTDQITYKEGVVSMPMMSSMAYQCVLLRVDEADVESAKQALKDNADLDKWVCVSAETMLVESRGDVIFFIMSDKNTAAAMSSAFQKL